MTFITHRTRSPDDTQRLAAAMIRSITGRFVVGLYGNLGSGKTCFVKGLAIGLGVSTPITSPTFTLIREYAGIRPLVHVDLYRLDTPEQAAGIGLEDYFETNAVTAVEWADRAEGLFPPHTVRVQFMPGNDPRQRTITVANWPATIPFPPVA